MQIPRPQFWNHCSLVVILGALVYLLNHTLTDLPSIYEKGVGLKARHEVRKVELSSQCQATLGCSLGLSFSLCKTEGHAPGTCENK